MQLSLERIKNRDRWSCRRCGHRFDSLDVIKFGLGDSDDDYITLCDSCIQWGIDVGPQSLDLFKRLITKTKIVFIGDCHGNFSALDKILTIEKPFDLFFSVGDFATLSDMAYVESMEVIDKWGDKGYFVKGNHDDVSCIKPLELYQEIGELKVAGLNGMIRNKTFLKDTSTNISFKEIIYLSHLRDIDILVTHQAPTGVFNGIGEPVLEDLLNYLVPKIYVFGHVHKFKIKFHLNTFMISLPLITNGYAVANFQGRDLRNIEFVLKKGKKFIRV